MLSEEKLKSVMAAVFEIPADQIGQDSNKDNISGWDSLKHMNLILALEEEFQVSIPDDEVGNLTSYPLIKLVMGELTGEG